MVIKRKGNDFGLTTEVIEIELTPQELEQAYRIKEKEYCMQEAEQVLQNSYENGQVDTVSYEKFKKTFCNFISYVCYVNSIINDKC